MSSQAVTYASYLRIDDLLALQVERSTGPDGPEHDELLFIVIHQVYELWFKQLRHELAAVQAALGAGATDTALHLLNRIPKILVAQVDVLETMTPLQFLSFRDRLDTASGFQSAGFRTVESMLGGGQSSHVQAQAPGLTGRAAIETAQAGPSVWDSILAYLDARGMDLPVDPSAPDARVQEALVAVYPGRHGRRPRCRTTSRSGRGRAGMALPTRQDSRAHDRHQARDGRLERCRVPALNALPAVVPGPLGDPLAVVSRGPPPNHNLRPSQPPRPTR